MGAALLTVGHGTLEAGELAALLRAAGVELVVDVRRFPGSSRHRRLLADHLTLVRGAAVEHLALDGRRTAHPPTDTASPCDGDVCYPPPQPAFTLR